MERKAQKQLKISHLKNQSFLIHNFSANQAIRERKFSHAKTKWEPCKLNLSFFKMKIKTESTEIITERLGLFQ